jgi:hypothetical protein
MDAIESLPWLTSLPIELLPIFFDRSANIIPEETTAG